MSVAITILQNALRTAESSLAEADKDLLRARDAFRYAKHNRDAVAISVTELQAAILALGDKPDLKNA